MPSHKPLKSVVYSFGDSIISTMNFFDDDYFLGHLLTQARKTKMNRFEVDILNNDIKSKELLTQGIIDALERYVKFFTSLIERSGSKMEYVKSATLIIEFDLQNPRPHRGNSAYLENSFWCETRIVDDRGKEYSYRHKGYWFPEKENIQALRRTWAVRWKRFCLWIKN